MGAPAAVTLAIVRSKTARRLIIGTVTLFTVIVLSIAAPLLTVVFIAGSQPGTSSSQHAKPPAAAPAAHVTKGGWTYPLVGAYWKGRGFGADPNISRVCSYCSTSHKGYDMSQACGATVHAAGPGRVTHAGSYFGYGNAVVIENGDGIATIYGHMQWGSLRVTAGQRIRAGTAIGSEGSTGNSTGCHLHFEVRVHGVPVNPAPFMAARGLPLK